MNGNIIFITTDFDVFFITFWADSCIVCDSENDPYCVRDAARIMPRDCRTSTGAGCYTRIVGKSSVWFKWWWWIQVIIVDFYHVHDSQHHKQLTSDFHDFHESCRKIGTRTLRGCVDDVDEGVFNACNNDTKMNCQICHSLDSTGCNSNVSQSKPCHRDALENTHESQILFHWKI